MVFLVHSMLKATWPLNTKLFQDCC